MNSICLNSTTIILFAIFLFCAEVSIVFSNVLSHSTIGKDSSVVVKVVDSRQDPNQKIIETDNKVALNVLNSLIYSKDGWKFVSNRDNVLVEKKFLPAGPYVSKQDAEKGSKHVCVKSTGIIKADPESVFQLFVDNSRVTEYNEHCQRVADVCHFPKKNEDKNTWTKIAWAFGPKYGPFKPRDFCSIVHFIKYDNGTSIILNRPAYDSRCAPTNKFVRATILLAGNIIRPYGNGQTEITQIAHINPGGGADTPAVAWIINKLCATGPPAFVRKLEAAALSRRNGLRVTLPDNIFLQKVHKWIDNKVSEVKANISKSCSRN